MQTLAMLTLALLFAVLLFISCGCDFHTAQQIEVTGVDEDYVVTFDMLVGASFNFRTGKDDRFDDLQWTFQETRFQIKAGMNGLPPDLAEKLLPEGMEATEVSGRWAVDDDMITFTGIEADGQPVEQPPRMLPTMFTGVLRIEAGPQYVFRMAR